MSPFTLFEAGVALLQLALLALLWRTVRRRNTEAEELRVHVPELAEVAYNLNALRTHLYQIGRALRQQQRVAGAAYDDHSEDGSFTDKKKGD